MLAEIAAQVKRDDVDPAEPAAKRKRLTGKSKIATEGEESLPLQGDDDEEDDEDDEDDDDKKAQGVDVQDEQVASQAAQSGGKASGSITK